MKADIEKKFLTSVNSFYHRFLSEPLKGETDESVHQILNGQLWWVMDEFVEAMIEPAGSFNFAAEIFDAIYATLVAAHIADWQLAERKLFNPVAVQSLFVSNYSPPEASLRPLVGRLKNACDLYGDGVRLLKEELWEDADEHVRASTEQLLRAAQGLHVYLYTVMSRSNPSEDYLTLINSAAEFVTTKNNNKTHDTHRWSSVQKKIVRI